MSRRSRKSEHDTAGRPARTASRQQKHPRQGVQSGNAAIDSKDSGRQPVHEAQRSYQKRPAKHR